MDTYYSVICVAPWKDFCHNERAFIQASTEHDKVHLVGRHFDDIVDVNDIRDYFFIVGEAFSQEVSKLEKGVYPA